MRTSKISMASSVIAACGYRRFLANLRRLDRVSSVSTVRNVPLMKRHMQNALYTTDTNSKKMASARESWPTIQFWKGVDFDSNLLVQKPFADFQEGLEACIRDKHTHPRTFYYMMSLKDKTRSPWTEQEAIDVLGLLERSSIGLTTEAQIKWVQYIEQEMRELDGMSLLMYQSVMDCYLKLNHPFDPVNILSEIEKKGLEPNHVWLQRLMKRYIHMGDIESARSIYDHIASQNKASYSCKSLMLMGYTMCGMDDDAEEIINSFRHILNDDSLRFRHFFLPLLLGNALVGNITRLKQLEIEIQSKGGFIEPHLRNYIITCSNHGAVQGAEFLIEYLGRCGTQFHDRVVPTLISLISNGHNDLAYKLFLHLEDPNGTIFFRAADRGEMPPREVMKYSDMMQTEGIRNSHFDYYLEILLRSKGKFDAIQRCFPILKENGMEIRPQDFWQILCNIRDNGSCEDLHEILPYYSPDGVTEDLFLFPCFKKFNVTDDQCLDLFTKAGNLNEDECRYLKLKYAVFMEDDSTACKIIEKGLSINKVKISADDLHFFKKALDQQLASKVSLDKLFTSSQRRFFQLSEEVVAKRDKLLSKESVERVEAINIATALAKSRAMGEAIKCLAGAKLEKLQNIQTSTDHPPFKCTLFDMAATERNLSFGKSYMEIMIKRGYLVQGSPDNGKRMFEISLSSEVIKGYLNLIFTSVDDEHLFDLLEICDKRRDLKTLLVTAWLSKLVKSSQNVRLKQVLAKLSSNKWHPDTITMCLAVSFLENGQRDKAALTLEKCQISSQSIMRTFNLLCGENKFKMIQDLYILLEPKQSNPAVKTELLKMVKLCGERTNSQKEGNDFYERHIKDIEIIESDTPPSSSSSSSKLGMDNKFLGTPV